MLFGGMQKLTTIDYPGTVSAMVFTHGCNFFCPYCHNPELVSGKTPEASPERAEIMAFLQKRAPVLEGLVISGGEPCLHDGLPDFCREVKDLGYKIKLDTNGSRPGMLEKLLLEGLADYVAMDLKTGPERYRPDFCAESGVAVAVRRSIEILRSSGVAHEFRTTCAGPFVDVEQMAELAGLVGESPWYLQKTRMERVLDPYRDMWALDDGEIAELGAAAAGAVLR